MAKMILSVKDEVNNALTFLGEPKNGTYLRKSYYVEKNDDEYVVVYERYSFHLPQNANDTFWVKNECATLSEHDTLEDALAAMRRIADGGKEVI